MSQIGFSQLDNLMSVFIDTELIGVIRKVDDGYLFVPGKRRRMMSADCLRAIAVKIEVMNMGKSR